MMKPNLFKVVSVVSVISSLVLTFSPFSAQAAKFGKTIEDPFDILTLKPANNANWWLINWGPDGNQQGRVEGYCGSVTCVLPVQDGGDHFARLSIASNPGGFYSNAEMAELHTGFPAEGQGQWTPTYRHPVVMNARARWSENYMQDGSGGAVGTSGIWLWNSPIDLTDPNSNMGQTAIGFNWGNENLLGGWLGGLKANVIVQSFPYTVTRPTSQVNMQDWVNLKMTWSVDANGVQSVNYKINNEDLGTTVLPFPLTNLSVEVWNDNSDAQLDEYGNLVLSYPAVPQNQNFEVDSITVVQE